MKIRVWFFGVISLTLLFSFQKTYAQTIEEKNLAMLYEKGVSSGDHSADSIQYYARLIQLSPTKSTLKEYYYQALNYLFYSKTGQTAETKTAAFETLSQAQKTSDPGLISDAYNNVALYYKELNNLDSSSYYFKLALNNALALKDENRFHQITINYANVLNRQGRKNEALEYVMNSITYDSLQQGNKNQGHNYHLLGNIHLYSGDFPAALSAYQISLAAYEKENNLTKRINLMNNIGLVYTSIEAYDKAEETYLKAIELIDANGLQREKVSALINLGTVYLNQGNYEKDKELLLEALAISEEHDFIRFQAQIQNNLGNVAYYSGDYATALEYFQKGLEINIITQNKHEQALCHSNTGWAYLMLGRKQECFDAFQKAYDLAVEIKSNEKRMMALEGLADASEYFGNYKDALAYKNRFVALKDSVLGEKTRNKILELETRYETEKKENQIEDLQQKQAYSDLQIRENDLEISRLNWQLVGLFLLIFVLLLITFVAWRFYRNQKEREKNQALLKERERGLHAVFEATEEERRRISRELHDGIGQQMSGLKLAWQNLSISAHGLTDAEKNKLHELSEILDSTAAEVRTLSHQMMPKVLESFGLVPALEEMLEKSLQFSTIKYQFEHYNLDQRLPQNVELAVFRIAQELVNNVIKHSKASFVSVQLFKNQQQLILIIEDNGTGFSETASAEGHGLLNIKSRLNTINGQVNFESSETAGTTVTMRVLIP